MFSYCISFITALYEPESVLTAAAITLAVTVALTIYAFTTKRDFTFCGAFLWIFVANMLMFCFFSFVVGYSMARNACCVLIAMLYGFYLVYDT